MTKSHLQGFFILFLLLTLVMPVVFLLMPRMVSSHSAFYGFVSSLTIHAGIYEKHDMARQFLSFYYLFVAPFIWLITSLLWIISYRCSHRDFFEKLAHMWKSPITILSQHIKIKAIYLIVIFATVFIGSSYTGRLDHDLARSISGAIFYNVINGLAISIFITLVMMCFIGIIYDKYYIRSKIPLIQKKTESSCSCCSKH